MSLFWSSAIQVEGELGWQAQDGPEKTWMVPCDPYTAILGEEWLISVRAGHFKNELTCLGGCRSKSTLLFSIHTDIQSFFWIKHIQRARGTCPGGCQLHLATQRMLLNEILANWGKLRATKLIVIPSSYWPFIRSCVSSRVAIYPREHAHIVWTKIFYKLCR
jgi:hypothetical protein